MRSRPARCTGRRSPFAAWGLAAALLVVAATPSPAAVSEHRRTAIVEAVQRAQAAIVNIHGEKTVEANEQHVGEGKRRVNGMGTGVIIDERGYIITNHHVVDGVKKIMVTTATHENYVAQLLSHDPKTDLAVIKVDADRDLEVIPIGTSCDLMRGETVIAVGNAFGYEHTVTRGIISALNRTVQVSEAQNYEDLIQTDASINPGNSGGPLLNIDGDMIGVNVAVRAGAQGIGFAIPVDKVLSVATELLSARRLGKTWHGLVPQHPREPQSGFVIQAVDKESPAATSGLKSGDVITAVGQRSIGRALDLERALIGRKPGEKLDLTVERNHQPLSVNLTLASIRSIEPVATAADPTWDVLGMKLEQVPAKQFQQHRTRYRGGLTVVDVRSDSPAARQGIRRGDILVGMHVWETTSLDNISYILGRPDFATLDPLKFYILRGSETLYGHLSVARTTR